MAKESKGITVLVLVIIFVLGTIGSVVALAWTGGGRVAVVETNLITVTANSDRNTKEISGLKTDISEAKVRDARIAGQYSNIEIYMKTSIDSDKIMLERMDTMQKIQGQQATIQAVDSEKLKQLTKD